MREYLGVAIAALVGAVGAAFALGYTTGKKKSSSQHALSTSVLSPAEYTAAVASLRAVVRRFPDFPKEGIVFRDFLPLLACPKAFSTLISVLHTISNNAFDMSNVDVIVGLDARGFLIGPSLAAVTGKPFVAVRKPGKLPGECFSTSYTKEYGADSLAIQRDTWADAAAVAKVSRGSAGETEGAPLRALIVDDVLATGGTLTAAVHLVRQIGGVVVGSVCVVAVAELNGAEVVKKATGSDVAVVMSFTDDD